MLKVGLLALIVVLAIICTEAKGGRRKDKFGGHPDCSKWTFGECTLQEGVTCGKGTKKGTRTGDNCQVKEKSFPCRVHCGMPAKLECQYERSEWSECNIATNTMTLTKTLKKGDTTVCEASKVITKKCKNKNGYSRKNSHRSHKGGSE